MHSRSADGLLGPYNLQYWKVLFFISFCYMQFIKTEQKETGSLTSEQIILVVNDLNLSAMGVFIIAFTVVSLSKKKKG